MQIVLKGFWVDVWKSTQWGHTELFSATVLLNTHMLTPTTMSEDKNVILS